jgi:orotidine-5'-phosphate decarboxylase
VTDNPIIVALDLPAQPALAVAAQLRERIPWVKVGMTLFYAEGPAIVLRLREMGFGVFVDLKLHDIPHQVAGAARQIARLGAGMMTVHASGGAAMMAAAAEAARAAAAAQCSSAPPAILAVTVLTSTSDAALHEVGVERDSEGQVALLASLALASGVDGVVCSPLEAAPMRALLGPDALIVTPGVRPAGSRADDQARVSTPAEALAAGASHLVIGRPITTSPDPGAAVDHILADLEGALP